MVQSKVYKKDALKKGIVTEVKVDFSLLIDDLANWVTDYIINHHLKVCDEKDVINL